ncbi:MAG: FecR domain-containing protein [Pseudorhizobium sp.]
MSLLASLLRLTFLCVIVLCPAIALSQDWTVAKTTKQVSYTIDKTSWQPVEAGSIVPNKAWISTGPRGRVTLTRDKESITLSPNTLGAVITTEVLFSRKTDVVQQKGEIALNIEKRGKPHTFVHTPYLAAAVKGTSFTVTVTERAASVSVDEGLVQVSSFTGGQSANVGPGQQVTVDQAQNMSVAGIAEPPSVFSVEPMQASVPAVGQAAPVGAGLGLGSFREQSSAGTSGDASSHGVSGESSESANSVDQQAQGGNNGNGNGGGKENGNSGNGNSGNGHGNGGGDGKAGAGNGTNANGGGEGADHNGNGGGNGSNGNGPGNGNNGNGHAYGHHKHD